MRRRAARAALAAGLLLLAPAAAQETPDDGAQSADGFTRTAIPPEIAASFRCVRANGETVIDIPDVASIVPDRIRGVMTFSVSTRDGRTHLIYLGTTTDCVLTAQPADP